jgi:hypothetical protein
MMESPEVRLARLEEAMVSVKGDTLHIRKTLDRLSETHWTLTGKQIGLNASISLIVSAVTVLAVYVAAK